MINIETQLQLKEKDKNNVHLLKVIEHLQLIYEHCIDCPLHIIEIARLLLFTVCCSGYELWGVLFLTLEKITIKMEF